MHDMNNKDHLKGVECDVTNCAYHGMSNCCCAPSIAIGPGRATCSSETACGTFIPKEID